MGDELPAGVRVAFVGRLAGMPRRDAEKLVRDRGGSLVERLEDSDWLVVGDEIVDLRRHLADRHGASPELQSAVDSGQLSIIRESEFWVRLGLVDADLNVARLYTPAMLAGLIGVPMGAIRQWHRHGALVAAREVGRLPYFDFGAVCAARKLASLWRSGCSLSSIHRKLQELFRAAPGNAAALADPDVVVQGRRLYVRRGESLSEPSGQLLMDFEGPGSERRAEASPPSHMAVPFLFMPALQRAAGALSSAAPPGSDELRSLAVELEDGGRSDQAIEVYRSLLVSGDSSADDQFALAELLYRAGDLAGARERYYMAIEMDEDFVEARSNLGCVLDELGDSALAEAAFRGALECHPDYADAHYHLARLLDRVGESEKSVFHWRQFIALAPNSPWVEEAMERVDGQRSE